MENHAVILFDGVCNLCNASVNFVIDRDPQAYFKFASLQSEKAGQLLETCNSPPRELESIVLIENGVCYRRSAAALRIVRRLTGAWPLLSGLIVLPGPVRDSIYRWIARNRYRWFGRRNACRVPTPELQNRFLEESAGTGSS